MDDWDPLLDAKALGALYRSHRSARRLLDYVASLRGHRPETPVALLADGIPGGMDRRDVVLVLQHLENAKCGKFILGRRGAKSRFQWDYPVFEVGRAAIAGASLPEVSVPATWREHSYLLRPDLTVLLSLPEDLTANEAARLADFVKTLSFQEYPAYAALAPSPSEPRPGGESPARREPTVQRVIRRRQSREP